MVSLIVFYLHIVSFVFGFSYQYSKEGIRSGLNLILFFIIIFTVGWSIIGMILKLFIKPEGFGIYLDLNGIILLTLTLIEIFFYRLYFKK